MRSKNSERFCSVRCVGLNRKAATLKIHEKWLEGNSDGSEATGSGGGLKVSFREALLEKRGRKCSICGWSEVHESLGYSPVEVDHADGNKNNNRLENLRVLCPNHHSLTLTFRRY